MLKLPGKALALILAAAVALLSLAFFLEGGTSPGLMYGQDPGPDSLSTSAIGFAGFYKVCEAVFGEASGRQKSLGEESNLKGRLNVVTGLFAPARPQEFKGTVLTILPKWNHAVHREKPMSWVGDLYPYPEQVPRIMAEESQSGEIELVRADWPESFQMALEGPRPVGAAPLQLIRGPELLPVISTPDGILLARAFFDGAPVFILSDPDIANNMGLARGQNAELMAAVMRFIETAAKTQGPPVFIEADEDFVEMTEPGLFEALFRMPLLLATILTCVTILFIAVPAAKRFGAPPKETWEVTFGKAKLIENSARLLERSGRSSEALASYLDMTLLAAAKLTRAPERLDKPRLIEWLDFASRARNLRLLPSLLASQAARLKYSQSQAEVLRLARDIHRWKTELEHGSVRNRRHSQ
jgi:hypothetical protein